MKPRPSFRVDRRFPGVGRINLVSGARTRSEFTKRDAMLTELYDTGRLELLRAIKAHHLTINAVYSAHHAGRLGFLASDVALQGPLWEALDAWLPRSARAEATVARYRTAVRLLRRTKALGDGARVADLAMVDWVTLRNNWPTGPTGWNHVRRAVSRFLTMALRDKFHPFRREVMGAYPVAPEPPAKVPDLSPEVFWRIVARVPEPLRPSYVTLALTGMRPGEYVRCSATDLLPHTCAIRVPGTKTAGSADLVRVTEGAWPWIKAAIPCPVSYGILLDRWKKACAVEGKHDLTLHSLRHFYAQLLSEAGQPEARIQHGLRHRSPAMTRRYTMQRDKGENARVIEATLLEGPAIRPAPVLKVRGQ